MAQITKQTCGLASLLPGPESQLPSQYITDVALTAGDLVYLKTNGNVAKALATDGTAVTDRPIGIVPKDYAASKAVTIHTNDVSYHYAEEGTLTPGTRLYLSGSVAGGIQDSAHFSGAAVIGYVESNGGSIRFGRFGF